MKRIIEGKDGRNERDIGRSVEGEDGCKLKRCLEEAINKINHLENQVILRI